MEDGLFVSVIIPTHNRSAILRKALTAYQDQDYPSHLFDIVVVDDGSADETRNVVERFSREGRLQVFYYYQDNQGPAGARNLGIRSCRGEIALIVNDDTIPSRNLISRHVDDHRLYRDEYYAVLGLFTWSPELRVTPFMRWLENGGPQSSYGKIKRQWAHWSQLWTCNISFKKRFLTRGGMFDEDFTFAAWEDVELGYRLNRLGLKLLYDSKALAYHYHPTSLASVIERMKKHGASLLVLEKKTLNVKGLPPLARPKLAVLWDGLDRVFFSWPVEKLMMAIATFAETRFNLSLIYDLLLLHYRIVGRREYIGTYA